jgi:5-methylcytosine-specific restriction protein A
LLYLLSNPLCIQCEGYGRVVPAVAVDHITPHRGDQDLFWDEGNWQPLCLKCHNVKTATEDGGFGSAAVLPPGMRPSLVPLTVVAGAPASGKSTLVQGVAVDGDLVLDLDAIRARLSGRPIYEAGEETYRPAMAERNAQLKQLGHPQARWSRAWLIASAPSPAARRWWRRKAGARMVVITTPLETCLQRIAADPRRRDKERHLRAAREWWSAYRPAPEDESDGEWRALPEAKYG